jgi:hypothetical protein
MKVFLITLILCSEISITKAQLGDSIIAKVGNKEISVAEFMARSEFIPRPDNTKDKSITLNNLIIEKILTLEAGKNNPLASNPGYLAWLKRRKEQAMREMLYRDVVDKKAVVDTNKLKKPTNCLYENINLNFTGCTRL